MGENFNISENNINYDEVAKVIWLYEPQDDNLTLVSLMDTHCDS